jgi:cellulose synthase/poly-beta-1,6-N-acetylglucosamine synthase-like glycosyltransferase
MALYLALLTAGAFLFRPKVRPDAPPMRFAVAIAAHNEELQIEACLRRIRESNYPADRYTVFVIADNCTDATAVRAREAGAVALERAHETLRAKSYALDWFVQTQRDTLKDYDAVAIVDADTQMDPNFLREMNASLSYPGVLLVQGFHGVWNPEANWRTALTYAAFVLVNGLRPAGRSFWGSTADLKGNGMAFRTDVLLRYGWPAHTLDEDIEFSAVLLLDNVLVDFNPKALAISEMPVTRGQADPQRRRWDFGRWIVVKMYAPRLLAAFVRERRWRFLDGVLELIVPPMSLLVLLEFVALGFAVAIDSPLVWPLVASGVLIVGYVCAGLLLFRAPRRVWLALLAAPVFVVWKLALHAGLAVRGGPKTWDRTKRQAELTHKPE